MQFRRFDFVLLIAACATLAAGCGGEPFPLTPVSGQVTYDDGSLIASERVVLVFVPQIADPEEFPVPPPAGRAEVDPADGAFASVTSHKSGDGIFPGRHKVLVHAIGADDLPTDDVPADYGRVETTPLEVDTAEAPFDLKVHKPQ
jgi:hypothetical protein